MFTKQKKLCSAAFYKKKIPLNSELRARKRKFDRLLVENLQSRDKFVVVCGPCSADNPDAMHEYLLKLKAIADNCPNLLVVARVYSSKPHSNGQGFKGAAFNLSCNDEVDLHAGIERCRQMMIDCLQIGLPVADELLYPELYEAFDDLVSYWFVGARSSEDSLHRALASGVDVCCGIKNGTDGSIEKVVDSLFAVSNPCVFPHNGTQITTNGSKTAHVVLRGGLNEGKYNSNISTNDVACAKKLLKKLGLNDFVMADLNHANSQKIAANQKQNAEIALKVGVDGVMIESYLYAGGQSTEYGTSQTDDCLSFEDTVAILEYLRDNL